MALVKFLRWLRLAPIIWLVYYGIVDFGGERGPSSLGEMAKEATNVLDFVIRVVVVVVILWGLSWLADRLERDPPRWL